MAQRRHDGYVPDFRFLVITCEGKKKNGEVERGSKLHFSKISGIESTIDYEEIQEGGKNDSPHILAVAHKKHQALVLEKGVIPVTSWMSSLKPGMRLGTWLQVIVLNSKGEMTNKRFWITDGIVTKWEITGLDAMGSSVLVERLEIVHDGIHYD